MQRVMTGGALQHEHNSWDLVRISKRNMLTVRCRVCQSQFKEAEVKRCVDFERDGICENEECCDMHVHRQKQKLRERVARHGVAVLAKVPVSLHPRVRLGGKGVLQPMKDASQVFYDTDAVAPQSSCSSDDCNEYSERMSFVMIHDNGEIEIY
eukprot:TRINITY_DN48005_c0_g1_i1.p1 TRINITY_DN48005_c0_g1~~TRINITY_DN48005_c0_g1_i1.p1  ORF type:complete len:153 (+),score=33.07 TRINITY_DN48005_c0_g1_i1:55-513(+)